MFKGEACKIFYFFFVKTHSLPNLNLVYYSLNTNSIPFK